MDNPFHNLSFRLSATSLAQLPPDRGAEVAVVGRSNSGKSSVINMIAARKGLARTSKTPGRTRAINIFALDETRRLMDLPGFGYARVSHALKEQWQQTLNRYLQHRRCLRGLVLVMDIRRPLSAFDLELLGWCQGCAMPVHVLLAKSDKLSRGRAAAILHKVDSSLQRFGPRVSAQLFSTPARLGVEDARAVLGRWFDLPAGDGPKKSPGNKGREPGA
ncbi:MAG: ribosome biogenesis GTP-binding protein YihA/YsxC [Gammaproteobacteria bacterium]|nr:MAG: ribosome biogenesis GTP-binding protein YihA/YsxC [Gammaproteobacteria bacterium]